MFRSRALLLVALSSLSATYACGEATSTEATSTDQALTEAAASAEDAKATADACFATFESCKSADGADEGTCRQELKDCLPAEAHPGPHCGPPRGKGKGHPRGPNGECSDRDGGRGPAKAAPADGAADRPEDGEGPHGEPGGHRGEGDRGGREGKEPAFCGRVPLPPPAAVVACRDAADTCLAAGTAEAECRATLETCVKAAFDAARGAAASTDDGAEEPAVNVN